MERNPLVFVLLLLHMCAHDLTLSRTSWMARSKRTYIQLEPNICWMDKKEESSITLANVRHSLVKVHFLFHSAAKSPADGWSMVMGRCSWQPNTRMTSSKLERYIHTHVSTQVGKGSCVKSCLSMRCANPKKHKTKTIIPGNTYTQRLCS